MAAAAWAIAGASLRPVNPIRQQEVRSESRADRLREAARREAQVCCKCRVNRAKNSSSELGQESQCWAQAFALRVVVGIANGDPRSAIEMSSKGWPDGRAGR